MRHTLRAACHLLPWEVPAQHFFVLSWRTEWVVLVAGAVRLRQGGDALLGLPDTGRSPRHGEQVLICCLYMYDQQLRAVGEQRWREGC